MAMPSSTKKSMRAVEDVSPDEMDRLVSDYIARQQALSVSWDKFKQEQPHLFRSNMVTRDTISVTMDYMNRKAHGIEFSEFIALINPVAMTDDDEWRRMLREIGNLWVNSKFTLNPKTYEITSGLLDQLTVQERPGKFCFRFWQEGPGYDRNLNTPASIELALDYIHRNPVRWQRAHPADAAPAPNSQCA